MRPPLHQDGIALARPKASAEPRWMERENTSGAVRWNSESNCANPEPNIVAAARTESVRAMTGRLAHLPRDVQLDPGKARCVPGARAIPLSGFLSIPSGSAGLRTNRHPGIPQRSQKIRRFFRSAAPTRQPHQRSAGLNAERCSEQYVHPACRRAGDRGCKRREELRHVATLDLRVVEQRRSLQRVHVVDARHPRLPVGVTARQRGRRAGCRACRALAIRLSWLRRG
jgi:hypothetical protein